MSIQAVIGLTHW